MATDETYEVVNMQCFKEDGLFKTNEQSNDLHTYYMSQFNLELENGCKNKGNKFDDCLTSNEQSYDFNISNNWNTDDSSHNIPGCEFQIINEVIQHDNITDNNVKDVLFDLDNIEFDSNADYTNTNETNSIVKPDFETNCLEASYDYIDDESLIDELCREDCEPNRLTPDIFNDSYLSSITNDKSLLPPIESAFAKHCCSYLNNDHQAVHVANEVNVIDNASSYVHNSNPTIMNSIENYSYPNNVINNINNHKYYPLPDTPTSCSEFTFDRTERKVSVSESIESDVHSSSYYDENSEGLDDEELFINLDEFGLTFEEDTDISKPEEVSNTYNGKKCEREKFQGERTCLWENCHEVYPNQNSLVEHIERSHVNTYKGDEFSCFWKDCPRGRRPFNARYKLLIHMRVHSGHKPNRCHHPGCGKAFSRLENLKIHVRSHTGERPYACPAPHCRKAFSNSSDRAKHQRTHFNARPYACGAAGCGKRYTDPSSLRKHVKSHPHVANVPRTCVPPTRLFRRSVELEQTVPSSPAKLTTLRCIRNKLATVPRLHTLA